MAGSPSEQELGIVQNATAADYYGRKWPAETGVRVKLNDVSFSTLPWYNLEKDGGSTAEFGTWTGRRANHENERP
jgi:hypothetical protein